MKRNLETDFTCQVGPVWWVCVLYVFVDLEALGWNGEHVSQQSILGVSGGNSEFGEEKHLARSI